MGVDANRDGGALLTRRRWLVRALFLCAAFPGLAGVACARRDDTQPAEGDRTPDPGTPAASPTQPREPGLHEVRAGGPAGELVFEPDRLRIAPGDRVRWVVISAGHSATAYHPSNNAGYRSRIPRSARPWDSGVLFNPGDSYEYVFETEGVYNYYCIPHEGAGMVGAVVVGRPLPGPGTEPAQPELSVAARKKLEELREWVRSLGS